MTNYDTKFQHPKIKGQLNINSFCITSLCMNKTLGANTCQNDEQLCEKVLLADLQTRMSLSHSVLHIVCMYVLYIPMYIYIFFIYPYILYTPHIHTQIFYICAFTFYFVFCLSAHNLSLSVCACACTAVLLYYRNISP